MATRRSKLLPEEENPVWVTYDGKLRQTTSVGIRKRKTKRASFVVEFRPPKSSTKEIAKGKIWAGTFESRSKAMRACDLARHLVGLEPYYFVYPPDYLPRRPSQMLSEATVKRLAKQYAEKPDELSVNPSSLFPDTSTSAPAGSPIVGVGSCQSTITPRQRKASNEVLEANVDLKEVEAKMAPAYFRGLMAPNTSAVNDLLELPSPEDFTVYSPIEGAGGHILDADGENPCKLLDWLDVYPVTAEEWFMRDLNSG